MEGGLVVTRFLCGGLWKRELTVPLREEEEEEERGVKWSYASELGDRGKE